MDILRRIERLEGCAATLDAIAKKAQARGLDSLTDDEFVQLYLLDPTATAARCPLESLPPEPYGGQAE